MKASLLQLETFVAVATWQHFGHAAEDLHVSQPTVSTQLRRLEQRLGLELVVRGRGPTRLTPQGEALLPAAERVLAAARALEDQAAAIQRDRERVRVVVTPSVVNRLLPIVLEQLEAMDGAPEIDIADVDTGQVVEEIVAGRADVGIGRFLTAAPGIGITRLRWQDVHVLTGAGVLDGAPVDLTELSDRRLLIWPRGQNPAYFDALVEICRARGVDPRIEETTRRFSGTRSYLLRRGEAFSLVPADYAADTSTSFSSAPLDPPARLPLDLAWRKPLVPGGAAFVRALRSAQVGAAAHDDRPRALEREGI